MSAPLTKGSDLAKKYANAIKGKVILITGVAPGSLGGEYIKTIAQYEPTLIILVGRTKSRLEEAASSLPENVASRILQLDLSSQENIRRAAKEVQGYTESIDVLVNNAGIMATSYSKTADGIESQLGCNHIGHFLFTNLIIDKLSSSARIINITSSGYRLSPIRFEDINFQEGKVYDKWRAYGQSKTANNLFSLQLTKRFKAKGSDIVSLSVHPGVIWTGLGTHLDEGDFKDFQELDSRDGHMADAGGLTFQTIDEGIATHIYASFDPELARHSGAYLENCHVIKPEEMFCWGRDEVDAKKLWKLSEDLVGQTF